MITEAEIRERLFSLLEMRSDLDSFEDWLVAHSWNMHLDSDESAQKLVAAVELRLAELSKGHLDEDAFKSEIAALLRPQLSVSGINVVSGASLVITSPLIPLPQIQSVHRRSLTEFALQAQE